MLQQPAATPYPPASPPCLWKSVRWTLVLAEVTTSHYGSLLHALQHFPKRKHTHTLGLAFPSCVVSRSFRFPLELSRVALFGRQQEASHGCLITSASPVHFWKRRLVWEDQAWVSSLSSYSMPSSPRSLFLALISFPNRFPNIRLNSDHQRALHREGTC